MGNKSFWTNNDGLKVGFGTRTVTNNIGTRPSVGGEIQQVVVNIGDATSLQVNTSAPREIHAAAMIPAGAHIKAVTVYTDTAFTSGGAATLDIGGFSDSGAVVDADGFATFAIADMNADGKVTAESSAAWLGTKVSADVWVGATYGTAVFTAGKGRVVIEYAI